MIKRIGGRWLAASFGLLAALASSAAIVQFSVQGTFNDGGTFSGTFGYDPVLNVFYTSVDNTPLDYGVFNITTTVGRQQIANHYFVNGALPPEGYDDLNSSPIQLYLEGGGHSADWTYTLDWKTPLNSAAGALWQPITGGTESYNDFLNSIYRKRQVASGFVQQLPATASRYATALASPRGLRFGPDGELYVAEAGRGGLKGTGGACTQVPPPVGPYTGGLSGRISKIDAHGKRTTVAAGFPSARDAQGDLIGVADVAFLDGELYALVAAGGCSHGHTGYPSGVAKVDPVTGHWSLLADIGAFLKAHPAEFESADDFEPDGTLYSLIAHDGRLYAVEPNHGQVLSITPRGEIKEVIDLSAAEGHIVPTSIAAFDGEFYIGNLNLFPIDPQWARVLTLSRDGDDSVRAPGFAMHGFRVVNSKAGFTTVVAVDFGPDGLLYVLELSDEAGFPTRGAGKVVRVARSGKIEDVVTGLDLPTGMTFGPDRALYISNLGAVPQGVLPPDSGQILRVVIP